MISNLDSIFMSLLRIPSVSGNEKEVAGFIQNFMERTAFNAKNAEVEGSYIFWGPQDASKKNFLLAGHMDTVPGHIPIEVRDGFVHGRGTVDMKSGLAIMMQLAATLDPKTLPVNLMFIFYTNEEAAFTLNGMKKIADLNDAHGYLTNIDLGIVLEPTDHKIGLGCQGTLHLSVTISGKPAHSARPWLGDNAIYKAILFLQKMAAIAPKPHIIEGLEFIEVLSVTQIETTNSKNVIPGLVRINLNHRFPPTMSAEQSIEYVKSLVPNDAETSVADVITSGKIIHSKLLDDFIKKTEMPVVSKQAYTDVGLLSTLGIPALNYGPGDPALAHKDNEHIFLADLDECFQVLTQFLTGC